MNGFPPRPKSPLKLGISQCLLGDEVRYDGTDAGAEWPHAEFSGLFTTRGICPEVGIGMSVPRNPIRLLGSVAKNRVVDAADSTIDMTEALDQFARRQVRSFGDLSGYVFMQNSPSCGLYTVKVHSPDNALPLREGTGAYAARVIASLPALPVEESGRLFDQSLRENFVARCFVYAHWLALEPALTEASLVQFHRHHECLLRAHSAEVCVAANRLLLNLDGDLHVHAQAYIRLLMAGLRAPVSHSGHMRALVYLRDELGSQLDMDALQALDRALHNYRTGKEPLSAVLALLRSLYIASPGDYARHEAYLQPINLPALA